MSFEVHGNDELKIRAALWFAWWTDAGKERRLPFETEAVDFVGYLCDAGLLGQEDKYYRFYQTWRSVE